jgi:uncharacterized protein YcbX
VPQSTEATLAAASRERDRVVGTVAHLWRYPVKSMLGEQVHELQVNALGSLGDRAWALRDAETGRIVSAKTFPRLLEFSARYETEPTASRAGEVVIGLPDGREVEARAPQASEAISNFIGRPLRLDDQPRADEKNAIDRDTVFGDVPVGQMKPNWTPETMPDYFKLKASSFLQVGAIYLLSSGSVAHLRALQGGTAIIDQRRFRPNIFISSTPEWTGFVEDSWLERSLAVGESLVCDGFKPTVWCVTSTLAQQDLPRDLSILRTIATHHGGCLGVYASVRTPGAIRVGDAVRLRAT